jgi:hypothetical protein
VWLLKFIIIGILYVQSLYAKKILELGESQVHAEKDQPEALTFISRSHPKATIKPVISNFKNKIKEEIYNTNIFDLVHSK